MGNTNNIVSIQKYRRVAASYDTSAEFTMPLRRRAIALLQLRPGQCVLDVGAGTGLSYELLLQGVGSSGRLLAFEQSPDMFAFAQKRAEDAAWKNVWHVCEPAETVQLPHLADAVLFNYVHDITRTTAAIDNILRQVKPGGKVVVAGMKFFPWWTGPLNLLAWLKNRPYNANPADLWSPWDLVQARCVDFKVQSMQGGMGYIACGTYRQIENNAF